MQNSLETVKTIADYLETPCTDLLAKDITTKCTLEKMRSANKDKHDDRNDSGPNPEMSNPDQMYRKGDMSLNIYPWMPENFLNTYLKELLYILHTITI